MPDAVASLEAPASRQERIDFLKQSMAFAEGNIRAYDTKAQISLAAFVLSGNPIIAIVTGACTASARQMLVIVLVMFVATVFTYLWVLWPVAPPQQKLTEGLDAKGLFYLHDPFSDAGGPFSERLKGLSVEPELTAEVLKLAFVRKIKGRRFKFALTTTFIAYLAVAAAFFAVGRCAFRT